jgi:hypothetical protein
MTMSLTHDSPELVWRNFMSTGFPLPSVRWTAKYMNFGTSSHGMTASLSDPINAGSFVFTTRPPFLSIGGEGYPLRPIWPGAILNTVFYGAILFGLWRAWIALKRRRRRKRNLCVRCAYSLAGITTSACPECGAAILPTSPLEGRGREAQPSG